MECNVRHLRRCYRVHESFVELTMTINSSRISSLAGDDNDACIWISWTFWRNQWYETFVAVGQPASNSERGAKLALSNVLEDVSDTTFQRRNFEVLFERK